MSMNHTIKIPLHDMSPANMQMLEDRGVIIRLSPGRHEVDTPEGQVGIKEVYRTGVRYGAHMLISATINRTEFSAFATHPENEDVFLIGDAQAKPLCFLFALCRRDEFLAKVRHEMLTADDLIALRARYNDVEVSCFTVVKDFPHGEAVMAGPGKPPTFFVTEQTDLPLDLVDFGPYLIHIEGLN